MGAFRQHREHRVQDVDEMDDKGWNSDDDIPSSVGTLPTYPRNPLWQRALAVPASSLLVANDSRVLWMSHQKNFVL